MELPVGSADECDEHEAGLDGAQCAVRSRRRDRSHLHLRLRFIGCDSQYVNLMMPIANLPILSWNKHAAHEPGGSTLQYRRVSLKANSNRSVWLRL